MKGSGLTMKRENPFCNALCDFRGKDLDDLLEQFSVPLRNHSRRVAVCSSLMAECAGEFLGAHDAAAGAALALAAHLGGTCHDIGKLLIPVLSTDESEYLRHPEAGACLLEKHTQTLFDSKEQAEAVLQTVRYHHERPDGNGFPYGLRAKEIPLAAGICAVADGLDYCLYLERESGCCPDGVLRDFKEQAGSLFCESAIVCLERAWPRISLQYAKWSGRTSSA